MVIKASITAQALVSVLHMKFFISFYDTLFVHELHIYTLYNMNSLQWAGFWVLEQQHPERRRKRNSLSPSGVLAQATT
jgi:hypothetical protein